LLLRAIRKWKELDKTFPPERQERTAFHEVVRSLVAVSADEENVHEAIAHCHRLFVGTQIPMEIKKLMEDPILSKLNEKVSLF
jgi:hypothetical protein